VAEYSILDAAGVVDLVRSHEATAVMIGDGEMSTAEIGDGNLNQVWIVRNAADPTRALILKQALPYLRVAGEGWPLTRERMAFETKSLLTYNDIAPEFAPRVLAHSDEQSWVAMEFLADHRVMRAALLDGMLPASTAGHLGSFVANLAFRTSAMSLSGIEAKALERDFNNPDLCDLQEQFVFTNPFFEAEENEWSPGIDDLVRSIRADSEVKVRVALAKHRYMTAREALLHGDLHTGSVMVSATNEHQTKIIDPEFSFYGPIGYDVGTLLAHFVINAARLQVLGEPTDPMVDAMGVVWATFVDTIEELWRHDTAGSFASADVFVDDPDGFATVRREVMLSIAADSASFGGCELLRRCMGIVSVADLETLPLDRRVEAERLVVAIARRWLLDKRTHTPLARDAVNAMIAAVTDVLADYSTGTTP